MERVNKDAKSGLSIDEIAAAVERDNKGQLDVANRLKKGDMKAAYESIAIAFYRAMRRRNADHKQALKGTAELCFITDIKVVLK